MGRFNQTQIERSYLSVNLPNPCKYTTTEMYTGNKSSALEQYHQTLLPIVEQTTIGGSYPLYGYNRVPGVDINGNILSSSQLSEHGLDKDNSTSTVYTSNNSLGTSWHNSSALGDSQGHSSNSYGNHFMHFSLPISPVNLHNRNEVHTVEQGCTSSERDPNEILDHSTTRETSSGGSNSSFFSLQQLADDRIEESDDDVPLTFTWEDAAEAEKCSSYFNSPPVEVSYC